MTITTNMELRDRVTRGAVQLMPQPQTALRKEKLDPMLVAAVIRLANFASRSR